MEQTNVMIVDDSFIAREVLKHILEKDPKLSLFAEAESAEEALSILESRKPDVITVDVHLPNMNGYELTRRIMESSPIPIIIISGQNPPTNIENCFKAMEVGALSILEKPHGPGSPVFEKEAQEILRQIKVAAGVKLVTRRRDEKVENKGEYSAVAIGGSLGGPQALNQILKELPSDFPLPIFVVQHISQGFIKGLVAWLQKNTNLHVVLAEHQQKAQPGTVYIAPDHAHMVVKKGGVIELLNEKEDREIQPSVSNLFHSISDCYGDKSIGVILTGMGRDGANELLEMKNRGAYTIAQDHETSAMFGMPLEAIKIGATTQVLGLDKIAPKLLSLVYRRKDDG